MLVRLVKMQFREEELENFKSLFAEVKTKIRNCPGCLSLTLLQGEGAEENIFYTYSVWTSEEDLNNYRASSLFGKTWKKTKAMFSDRPAAISLQKVAELL